MKEDDKKMDELLRAKAELETKERNADEDMKYYRTTCELRELGCDEMTKHDNKVEKLRLEDNEIKTRLAQDQRGAQDKRYRPNHHRNTTYNIDWFSVC